MNSRFEREATQGCKNPTSDKDRCSLSGIPRLDPGKPQSRNSAEGLRKAAGR